MGRPSTFTPERAAAICERLAAGESLRAICRDEGMPSQRVVFEWLAADGAFAQQYARARSQGLDEVAQEIIEISDEVEVEAVQDGEAVTLKLDATAVARNRLRVDARKWLLAKLAPKKYGERLNLEHSGSIDLGDRLERARAARKAGGAS